MKNDPKRGIKRKPGKVRRDPRPPLDTGSTEDTLLAGLQAVPLVQVVLDSLAHPLYVIDVANYHVRLVNRAARETYANDAATCYALTHHRNTPCQSQEHPCPIEIIKETGEPTVVEHIHYNKDGTPRNVEVHAFPIFDKAGVLVQIIEYNVDITARKQAEAALHQSERRFRGTFENAPMGIAHVALDGRILRFNGRFCEIVGCPCGGAGNATCEGAAFADDGEAERAQIQRLLDGAVTHYSVEKRYVHREGGPLWVNLTRSVQRDETGRPEYFIVLVEDISQRKHAEEALRESEERQRRLIENLKGSHFIYVHDTRGVFQYLTGSLTEILGYTPEEFMAHYSRYLTDHPVNQAVRRHTELSIQGVRQPPYEVNIWHKDGSSRWLEVQEVPVFDAMGQVVAVEGVAQDITTRKRMEEELRQHAEHLEELVAERTAELLQRTRQLQKLTLDMSEAEDRERRRLAEILHDDLQQTLAGARFHVGLMRNQARQDASLLETVGHIDHLLKDAIEESRRLSHELSPAVLHHDNFAETLRWLANQAQTKHGLLARVYAHGPVRLQSATLKAFLYRAIQELLFNVIKHAGVHEAGIRIRRRGRWICLSVCDRGRGFDPEKLRGAAGFGLLSIRERIELLGGRMKIRSAPGAGSTVLIVVPDGSLSDEASGTSDEGGISAPRPASPTPLRIVLADDHEVVQQGLVSLLAEEETIVVVGEGSRADKEEIQVGLDLQPKDPQEAEHG